MAPPKGNSAVATPPFSKDEKVLCFHMGMLYDAKVTETKMEDGAWKYKIHYKGWKNTVCHDSINHYGIVVLACHSITSCIAAQLIMFYSKSSLSHTLARSTILLEV